MNRSEFMSCTQRDAICSHEAVLSKQRGKAVEVARTHQNMKEITGVRRPGKTAKDRAQS